MQKGNAKVKNRKNYLYLALLTSYSIPWRVESRTRIEYRLEVDTRPNQNVETEYSSRVRRLISSTRAESEGWYRNSTRRSVYTKSLWEFVHSSLWARLSFLIHIFFAHDHDRSAVEWDLSNDEGEDRFYAHESLSELLQRWVD